MAGKTFTAQLRDIEALTLANMRYVAASAIQDVAEAAQTPQLGVTKGGTYQEGKIPVADGDLIASLQTRISGGMAAAGADSYSAVIAGFEIGERIEFEWTVAHALPMEAGYTTKTGKQVPGRHFVGKNAARFSEFVEARVAEVKR